jgi:hypothetical protein
MEIKEFYLNDQNVSIAEVFVGEEVVEVKFWGSYTAQFENNAELEAYLNAEANKKIGKRNEAKETLLPFAKGKDEETQETVEIDGREVTRTIGSDNRNWAKIWIDAN